MGRFQIYLNFNQLIRLRSHMERLHGVELMEAMAGFHTFDNGICQDTSKKLVRSLFIPEEPQQGLCPYASLPQDIFLT